MSDGGNRLIDDLIEDINHQREIIEAYESCSDEAEKASVVLKNNAEAYAKIVEAETKSKESEIHEKESKVNILSIIVKSAVMIGTPIITLLFVHHENQTAMKWESDGNYIASQTSKNTKSLTDSLLRNLFPKWF